jgi:hypothetical protein
MLMYLRNLGHLFGSQVIGFPSLVRGTNEGFHQAIIRNRLREGFEVAIDTFDPDYGCSILVFP